jgi:hypothetical protein
MSALLDSMAQAFCGSDARREVLDAALRDGLPAARNEAWKYTSLRQLERRAFAAHRCRARRWTPRCWPTSRRRAWCSSTAAWMPR